MNKWIPLAIDHHQHDVNPDNELGHYLQRFDGMALYDSRNAMDFIEAYNFDAIQALIQRNQALVPDQTPFDFDLHAATYCMMKLAGDHREQDGYIYCQYL